MSWLREFHIFCMNEGLDFESSAARRRFETGAEEIIIRDGHALMMDEIDALTGEVLGTSHVQCPYCGVPGRANMKIERPSLGFAKWVCFYCGRSGELRGGGPIDPAKEAEARRRAAALDQERREERRAQALRLWRECVPLKKGDAVHRYLEARGIYELPSQVDEVLRIHPLCPFGTGMRRQCMVALMRDVKTDEPRAVHRTWVSDTGHALGRMAMGPIGRAAVKLWPLDDDRLTVGEGIETTLAAVTRLPWRAPLKPGWALTVARNLAELPVIENVRQLRILVDNDESGTGQKAAARCATRWAKFECDVIKLMPPKKGEDFNDLVRESS